MLNFKFEKESIISWSTNFWWIYFHLFNPAKLNQISLVLEFKHKEVPFFE